MSAGDSLSSIHSPPVYQSVQHLVDKKGRLWQEKTLVIKPNDHGYGFSLSGEKPVFVDSVVDGGPAYKAGIRRQDRLLKVDGQSVFDKTHTEVVSLLKGATIVSLTIITQYTQISRDQSDSSGGAGGPQMIQELTLNALKTMLEKQQSTYEQLVLDYSKGASTKLEQEIRECEDTIKTLQAEIAVKASSVVDTVAQTTEASINTLLGSDKASERRGRLAREDSLLAQKILCTITADDDGESSNPPPPHSSSTIPQSSLAISSSTATKYKSPKMFRKQSLSKTLVQQVDSAPHSRTASPTKVVRTQSVLNDSDLSDEDLEFGIPHYGPFSSLQELNNYPAHMSVFLHYLFQNKEPKYLCFYLVAHSYQNHYKGNELKQKGLEILWTFCFPTSPLYVGLSDSVTAKILDTLENEENDMKLKSVFVESRDVVAYQIAEDLTAYRHKRTLGLGSMYGEQQLTDHMTPAKESETSNSTLIRILKDIISDRIDGVEDVNKNHALSDSVSTFLMDINKGKTKFDSSISDRMQSFTRTELGKRKSGKTKKQSRCGHSFQLSSYQKLTLCDHCDRVLWGILYQGYQCSTCEMNVHRYGCIDENLETCSGKKKKKFPGRKASGDSEAPHHISAAADNAHTFDDDSGFRSRRRSVSDPKQTLLAVNLAKEEESVQEEIYSHQKKKRSIATVSRTQSLKERRSDGTVPAASGHPQSSQDTSLNTTPSWTSVASSSSVSDESLNNSSLTSGSVPTSAGPMGATGIIRGSTLDTVIEDGKGMRSKSPFFDEETLSELKEADVDEELIPWSLSTASSVVRRLQKFEVQRQELLKEFMHTEKTHLKKLVIMKHIYRNQLYQFGLLSLQQTESLFPSLDRLVELHSSFCNDLRDRQAQYYDGVVQKISDVFLTRFEGKPGEQLSNACAIFASNQSKAEKLIKEHSAKVPKFKKFLQDAESNQYCNRRSIKELLPCVWTRLTRYQLLLESIHKLNKKHFDKLKPEDKEESEKLSVALDCVRNILVYVNMVVKQTENRQKLQDYQSRLDSSHIDRSTHQITEKYKDINLTAEGRILLHEGILTWKISHRKTVEVKALLLSDILVLLHVHNQEDTDKVILKQYHIEPIGVGEVREEISPIIRVKEMILRHYATDKGGRSFLVVNNSPLMKRAQMYEFTAESAQEKKKWEDNIENAMKGKYDILPELLSPTIEDTSFPQQIPLIPRMSTVALREQLDKIDDSIQKQLQEKLSLLRSLQSVNKDDSIVSVTHASPANIVETSSVIFHTVGELTSQVSKLLVPNPTKQIVADVQYQLAELTSHLHSGLSELLMSLGKEGILQTLEQTTSGDHPPTSPQLDETSDATTVSPSDDQYIMINESTPNATPLPNGTHNSPHMTELVPPLSSDDKRQSSVLNRVECIDQESDDEEGGSPPPLPHKPPPSSSSASSATPPDLLDDETPPILPRACSEFSMESYDLQSDSYHQLIAPPEGFSDFTVPHPSSSAGQKEGASPPKRSMSDNVKKEGFRRVRSNPSIVSTKVMSVISSASPSTSTSSSNNDNKFDPPSLPSSVLSNNSMKRTSTETVPLTGENEYVIKLKDSSESIEGET